MKYRVLAYYCYVSIDNPELEVKKHHHFLKGLNVRARVYIAKNGINAQMSFAGEDLKISRANHLILDGNSMIARCLLW